MSLRGTALLVVLMLLLAGCGDAGGDAGPDRDAEAGPGEPVERNDTDDDAAPPPLDPGDPEAPEPELRQPVEAATDTHPASVEYFEVVDERTVRAVWWGGVEPCHVLADVEVEETPEEVRVRVLTGDGTGDEDIACIMIAVLLAAEFELDEDLGDRTLVDAGADEGREPDVVR